MHGSLGLIVNNHPTLRVELEDKVVIVNDIYFPDLQADEAWYWPKRVLRSE